jgi:cellulose 1,4-beta-cellobiosidase
MDAGHAGWLGWPANLQPAATLFAEVYSNASKPAYVKGLATSMFIFFCQYPYAD